MPIASTNLLLIGGGHAHIGVLADRIRRGPAAGHAVLVTPSPTLRYSGMVPGWICGHYSFAEGIIDLAALAHRAGVELVLDRCVALSAADQVMTTSQSGQFAFDTCSIDVGGVGRSKEVLGQSLSVVDVRPIDHFVAEIRRRFADARQAPRRVAVVGSGAGGVELAFAFHNASFATASCMVALIPGKAGVLPGFGSRARTLALRELRDQGIPVLQAGPEVVGESRHSRERFLSDFDLIVAALGSAPPSWPRRAGLLCDPDGYIAVDKYQRSLSHPRIFAVGDAARRVDRDVPRSGVHAVHAGPFLAKNLRAMMEGQENFHSYLPRPASLYLLATGNGAAIACYGPLAASGKWAGALKRKIDRRWVSSFGKSLAYSM